MAKGRRLQSVWMSTGEVAAVFGITPSTVIRWIDKGRLVCIRTPGGHRRVATAGVEQLLACELAGHMAAKLAAVSGLPLAGQAPS